MELENENNAIGYRMFETTFCFGKRAVLPMYRPVVRVGEIGVLVFQDTAAAGELKEGRTGLPRVLLYR